MKKLFLIILLGYTFAAMAQPTDSLQVQLARKWENNKDYAIKLVASYPESAYGFKPSPEEMSFQEQVLHIADNINWLSSSYLMADAPAKRNEKSVLSKQELLTVLADAYDRGAIAHIKLTAGQLDEKIKFFAGPKTRRQMLILMHDHQTHHLGQLIVYLRLNGIKPPSYVGW